MTKIFAQMVSNAVLWTAIVSWAIAQLIKIIIEWARTRRFNAALIVSSGGMPSSHTSFVTAMTTYIGIKEGFDSSIVALSLVFSLVVMYDAVGVRRAAGHHASAINTLFESFAEQGLKLDKKLKELLGHSPIEVAAGALLGITVAIIAAFML
ncbi:MAG: divergent PAP2 family protein [Clostridiales bacterium]|nr:divergent PAP2 family protein [Clostridiales bacterium]